MSQSLAQQLVLVFRNCHFVTVISNRLNRNCRSYSSSVILFGIIGRYFVFVGSPDQYLDVAIDSLDLYFGISPDFRRAFVIFLIFQLITPY